MGVGGWVDGWMDGWVDGWVGAVKEHTTSTQQRAVRGRMG